MFVREKKIYKGGKVYGNYYQVVQSNRVNGTVRQKLIAYLGTYPDKAAAVKAAVEAGYPVGHYKVSTPKPEPKKAKAPAKLPAHVKKIKKLHEAVEEGKEIRSKIFAEIKESTGLSSTAANREMLELRKAKKTRSKHYKNLKHHVDTLGKHNASMERMQLEAAHYYGSLSKAKQEEIRVSGYYPVVASGDMLIHTQEGLEEIQDFFS